MTLAGGIMSRISRVPGAMKPIVAAMLAAVLLAGPAAARGASFYGPQSPFPTYCEPCLAGHMAGVPSAVGDMPTLHRVAHHHGRRHGETRRTRG